MPALPYPSYGISNLYLFPWHQTRDKYKQATGEEAPPWDPKRPPKYWMDPSALQSTRRNVVYEYVLAMSEAGTVLPGPDGKPMLDVLVLLKEEAAAVNIPPDGANVFGADVPCVPVPLRPLEPNEELVFGLGGMVSVKNLDYVALENGFTADDRTLLRRIAQKLGV